VHFYSFTQWLFDISPLYIVVGQVFTKYLTGCFAPQKHFGDLDSPHIQEIIAFSLFVSNYFYIVGWAVGTLKFIFWLQVAFLVNDEKYHYKLVN